MGKKGVMLDNGKNAQSSMALYWKKHQQQSKKPKKQYEPTQQQQLDQRVESGFQKWKLHKQKMISKSYEPKQKQKTEKISQKIEQEQSQEQVMQQKVNKKSEVIKIPGFKSKQALKSKLKPQYNKEVSQADNVLKLPNHLQGITQDDIVRILRQKKAQAQMSKKKQAMQMKQDVILGDNFLESFKTKPENKQKKQEQKVQQKVEQKPIQNFFKSDILNQISKGNYSSLSKQTPPLINNKIQPEVKQVEEPQVEVEKQQQHSRPLFKPRVLNNHK